MGDKTLPQRLRKKGGGPDGVGVVAYEGERQDMIRGSRAIRAMAPICATEEERPQKQLATA